MNRDDTSCKTIIVVHQIVWFQKISIPPTPARHGTSLEIPRGRGFKGNRHFRGVGGYMGKLLFQSTNTYLCMLFWFTCLLHSWAVEKVA